MHLQVLKLQILCFLLDCGNVKMQIEISDYFIVRSKVLAILHSA